jgi:hypothetical protein
MLYELQILDVRGGNEKLLMKFGEDVFLKNESEDAQNAQHTEQRKSSLVVKVCEARCCVIQ